MKKIFLIFIVITSFCSCHKPVKNGIYYSKDYAITIETRGCMPGESVFTAVIYNIPQYQLIDYASYKPHHLYITRQDYKKDSIIADKFDLKLSSELEDSIYNCVHKYLSDFYIDNKELVINGTIIKKNIQDGACLSIQLEQDKKLMKCEQYNLEGIHDASPEIKKLLEIINSKVEDKFRLY